MSTHSEAKPVRDWQDIFPWLILFRSVRIAIGFRLLLLAALGLGLVLLTCKCLLSWCDRCRKYKIKTE